jgi:alkanesulfonate monooxygenase SsuD/methylene tetrahydromethanopterin reductase-like flavin-dependent oxidoreductase (luciferase family)
VKFGLGPIEVLSEPRGGDFGELEAAVACAEAEGFDSVWVTDALPGSSGAKAAVALACAALVSTTRWIRLGATFAVGHVHPLELAEEISTLDNIVDGRLDVALTQAAEHEFSCRGVDASEIPMRVAESIALVVEGLAPLPISKNGGFFPVPARLPGNHRSAAHSVVVTPRPVQDITVLLDGDLQSVADLAADTGAEILVPREVEIADVARLVRGARWRAVRETYVARTRSDLDRARRRLLLRHGRAPSEAGFARERFIVGDAEHCVEQLERLRTLGCRHVICALGGAADATDALDVIERLSADVVPHLRTAP